MYILDDFISMEEVLTFVQESATDDNDEFKGSVIDPIISVLKTSVQRKKYIEYGNTFLEVNSVMLSKEYPTKAVVFPPKYIDEILDLFGFELEALTQLLKHVISVNIKEKLDIVTITKNPTNVIHSIVLYYSDMIGNRELRDSARQQLGLSIYNNIFKKYYTKAMLDENVMAYTYMQLDASWGLVKSENIVNWIGATVETSYGFWRTKMSVNMSIRTVVNFLNRLRDSFNQNMQHLAVRYYKNNEEKNSLGSDTKGDEQYLVTKDLIKLRQNLVRMIKDGDALYSHKSDLYVGISKIKNVKLDTLYQFSKKVEISDIEKIIDNILYVFITRDGNKISDINTTKYISGITNIPTRVDRAIAGKPIVLPMMEKYEAEGIIVRAYICLIATYILKRVNNAT